MRCRQCLSAELPEKAPRWGIIQGYSLAQGCPQPVPRNYSKCDSVVGFGISEMQTPFWSRPFHIFQAMLSLSPLLSVTFSSLTTERTEELARRCFKGLSPFSLWQPWLSKCRAVTLATALIPLHFKPGGGDAAPDQHSLLCAPRSHFITSTESLKL